MSRHTAELEGPVCRGWTFLFLLLGFFFRGKRWTSLGGLNVGVDGRINYVEISDEGLELRNVLVVRMIVWKFVVL